MAIEQAVTVSVFNDTATTEIYTLSLHDALPILARGSSASGPAITCSISAASRAVRVIGPTVSIDHASGAEPTRLDRKSTRLNSSHANISYAVFCLKKKTHYVLHQVGALRVYMTI